jgi:hypothetical protein
VKRSPGRPPLDDEDTSVYVGVTVTAKTFDDLCARARRDQVSVPEIIRRDLDKQKKSKK